MTEVPWMEWYQSLAKPSWTPALRTIGLIRQLLYPIIVATFGYVVVQVGMRNLPLAAVPVDRGKNEQLNDVHQCGSSPGIFTLATGDKCGHAFRPALENAIAS